MTDRIIIPGNVPIGPKGDQGLPGTPSSAWTPTTAYSLNQVVQAPDGSWIKCTTAHTSSAAFATDASSKWKAFGALAGTKAYDDLSATYASPLVFNAIDSGRSALNPSNAVAGTATDITTPTPDGSGVAVHPSVVYARDGWNGYRYWMAMTPYQNADSTKENPSLLVSQDGETWSVPAGVTNPLVAHPGGSSYNSDVSLVFGSAGTLYLFYRLFDVTAPGAEEKIRVVSSTDGIAWTSPQTVIANNQVTRRLLSPSVVYEPTTQLWVMYAVDIVQSPRKVVRLTATSPTGTWSATPTNCTITGNGGEPWHLEVHKVDGQWQMLVQDGGSGGGDLWVAVSEDGLTWAAGPAFLPRSTSPFNAYYKSSFVPAIRDGLAGWDMWVGGAAFGASGPQTRRCFVSFADRALLTATAGTVDILSARAKLPPWIAADAFARADSAGLGTADTGEAWTASTGTFNVTSKAAVPSAAANTRVYIEVGSAEQWVHAQVVNALNTHQAWLVARLVDGNNYYRLGVTGAGAPTQIELQKIVAGSVTTLAAYPSQINATRAGEILSLRCTGTSLTAYRNGVALGSPVTDSAHSGTKAGLQATTTGVSFRNFAVRTP